jgi:hypothetical protein
MIGFLFFFIYFNWRLVTMFRLGAFLMLIGTILVYGTAPISKRLNMTTVKGILTLKGGGLLLVVLGAVLLFLAQRPGALEFLKLV